MSETFVEVFLTGLFCFLIIFTVTAAIMINKLIKRALPRADDDTESVKIKLYKQYENLYKCITNLIDDIGEKMKLLHAGGGPKTEEPPKDEKGDDVGKY